MSYDSNEWSDGVNVGMQLGIRFEHERIVALIEANCYTDHYDKDACYCDTVALIKG